MSTGVLYFPVVMRRGNVVLDDVQIPINDNSVLGLDYDEDVVEYLTTKQTNDHAFCIMEVRSVHAVTQGP